MSGKSFSYFSGVASALWYSFQLVVSVENVPVIFPTRFECISTSSPLVSSAVLHLPHSFRAYFSPVYSLSARYSGAAPLVLSMYCSFEFTVEKNHPERGVRSASLGLVTWIANAYMKIYTRNEWRRWKNTLETSRDDVKLHSKGVEKMEKYTRNECIFSNLLPAFRLRSNRIRAWLYFLFKMFVPFCWRFGRGRLYNSTRPVQHENLHSKRMGKM